MTVSQIARENNCSHSTIIKHLKLFKIERLNNFSSQKEFKPISYGKKSVSGKVHLDKSEQSVIRRMKILKQFGNSYWKIADILNKDRVPTKSQSGKWHSKTVYQILKREN